MTRKWFLFFIFFLLFSCVENNRFELGADAEKIDVSVQRFDLALIKLDTINIVKSIENLQKEFPNYSQMYVNTIFNEDSLISDFARKKILRFLQTPDVKKINDKIITSYSNVDDIEEELSYVFSGIHYYFPTADLPSIVFCFSGLSKKVFYNNDTTLSVGTEFYLGSDFPLYSSYFYDYQLIGLNKKHLTVDVTRSILESNFPYNLDEKRLLEVMIYQGRLLFLTSVLLPKKQFQDILGYDDSQWEWATNNERTIWRTIVEKKHLLSSNEELIHEYTTETPFTMPISQDSPGRLGLFIGFQIVKSYMEKNQNIGLKELMLETNAQNLLSKSGYQY